MKSFDEWFDRNDVRILVERSNARFVYEAGAQSRQAEIDELEKRIDGALFELEQLHLLKTTNSNNAIKILKGETHES